MIKRKITRWVVLVGAMAMAMSIMGGAGIASALPAGYTQFAQCPRTVEGVTFCLHSETIGGEAQIGKSIVPITNPIVLQGGYYKPTPIIEKGELKFVAAINSSETLTKAAQPVPGGLAGLVKCNELSEPAKLLCKLVFENGLTGVNAITELALPPSSIKLNTNNLINGKGIALTLPVKIRLENPLLGSNCYIGSEGSPITWKLTSGSTSPPPPNETIKGATGTVVINPATEVIEITGNELVDNSFAAPGASGCGGVLLESIIDPVINAKLGLPSAEGNNSVRLKNTVEDVTVEKIKEAEEAAG